MDVENLFPFGRIKYYLPFKCKYFNEWFLCNADHDADNISNFIVSYAVSIPNLVVRNFS